MTARMDSFRCSLLLVTCLLGASVGMAAPRDEASLRRTFSREMRSRAPEKRVLAVKKLEGCKEDKTIALLVKVLRDPAPEVRKAAAGVLATATDGAGTAIKPLAAGLLNTKDQPDVRLACAKALAKARYRAEPIDALIQTISGIDKTQRHLFKFGADCTAMLNALAGQDFGAGKDTPKKWQNWWKKHRAAVTKEDVERRKEYKKSSRKK